MKKRKVLWLITMAALGLMLLTIVSSRSRNMTQVVFGEVEGAFVNSDLASLSDPNAVETPEPTVDIWPKIDLDSDSRFYSVIREGYPLSSAYDAKVGYMEDYYVSFYEEAIPYLEALIAAAKDAGFNVVINSAYRSYSYQNRIYNGYTWSIAESMGIKDYNDPDYQIAAEEAKKVCMAPGYSEHQLGTAVDLMDRYYSPLVYENMNQKFFAWLDAHCAEYGFIKRYPTKKLLITGWDEPWHYRFVGVEAATFIMENDLCLEEFYAHYNPDFEY